MGQLPIPTQVPHEARSGAHRLQARVPRSPILGLVTSTCCLLKTESSHLTSSVLGDSCCDSGLPRGSFLSPSWVRSGLEPRSRGGHAGAGWLCRWEKAFLRLHPAGLWGQALESRGLVSGRQAGWPPSWRGSLSEQPCLRQQPQALTIPCFLSSPDLSVPNYSVALLSAFYSSFVKCTFALELGDTWASQPSL